MADSLAELIRDPAYVTMDPHERMKSFFDTAAKDALFQYSRPEVQRETARRILSGTAHHALSQIAEDAGPALDVMDDPRFAAAGTGITTGGIATGNPVAAGAGTALTAASRLAPKAKKFLSKFKDVTPDEFVQARSEANRQEFLTPHNADDLKAMIEKGGKVRMHESGKSGYVISPEGDLQNVFSLEKGQGTQAVEDAIKNGAYTLDAFDPYLPEYYKKFGFKETGRAKFDPQYAPEGWDYEKYGKPDVVFMTRPHITPELKERFKSPTMSSVGAEARVQEPAFLNKESPAYKNDLGIVGAWSLLAGNKTRKEWDSDMRRVLPSHLADADKKTLDDVYKRSGAALDKFRKVTGKDPAEYMQGVLGRQVLGQKAGGADWYENVMPTLEKWFGKEDAPVFAKFLAATSPLASAARTSDVGNVPKAIRAFLHYKQSGDADEFIKRITDEDWGIAGPPIRSNLARVYNGEQFPATSPKVHSFYHNLSGENPNLTTVDTQMYRGHGFASNYRVVKNGDFGRKWIDAFVNRSTMAQRLPNNAAAQSVDWHGIKTVEGMMADDKLEPFRKTIHNVLADDRYWPKIKQAMKLDNPPAYLDESGKVNWKMAATLSAVSGWALQSGKIDPDKIREKLASFKINMPPKLFNEFVGGLKSSPSMNADENRQLEEVMRELTPSR